VDERVVEKKVPHGVDQLTTAMRQDIPSLRFPLLVECGRKVTKVVGELQGDVSAGLPSI
jgi:hypothetical protein